MAIIAIESVHFGVEDITASRIFFADFGLSLVQANDEYAKFELANGATVHLHHHDDPRLPDTYFEGSGLRETIWGVDTEKNLKALIVSLRADRAVRIDEDKVAHFTTDCGIPMGLTVFAKKTLINCPDRVNATDNIQRLNQNRRWRTKAHPKCINHVVFNVEDYPASAKFMIERLGFRVSDHSRHLGLFLRADGMNEHHSSFFKRCTIPNPKGQPGFEHICFGVEDVDEIMAGANHMTRKGWHSPSGLGRHRIGSALFYYLDSPLGGQVEYGADTDYLDDNWIARDWEPMFGNMLWAHELPPYMKREINWDVKFETEFVSAPKG